MERSILIQRVDQSPFHTIGTLTVRGDREIPLYECVSLELPWRNNAPRISCVPAGTYTLRLEYSPSFKTDLYELKGVPGRSEVKIHIANYVSELRGCIAPGLKWADLNKDGIIDAANSRDAFAGFMRAMGDALRARITILDP